MSSSVIASFPFLGREFKASAPVDAFARMDDALERCAVALELVLEAYSTLMNCNFEPDELFAEAKHLQLNEEDEMAVRGSLVGFMGFMLTRSEESAVGVTRRWMDLEMLPRMVRGGRALDLLLVAAVLEYCEDRSYMFSTVLEEAGLDNGGGDDTFREQFAGLTPCVQAIMVALLHAADSELHFASLTPDTNQDSGVLERLYEKLAAAHETPDDAPPGKRVRIE